MRAAATDEVNKTLRQALAVAGERPRDALRLLDAGMEAARTAGDRHALAVLARHAGLVSAGTSDVAGAMRYYDEAVRADPQDAYLHLARGDLYRSLGQDTPARSAFAQSLRLATEQGDVDAATMATAALAARRGA